jgi:hypothetical protein
MNRKERFFTGTVPPMIACADGRSDRGPCGQGHRSILEEWNLPGRERRECLQAMLEKGYAEGRVADAQAKSRFDALIEDWPHSEKPFSSIGLRMTCNAIAILRNRNRFHAEAEFVIAGCHGSREHRFHPVQLILQLIDLC